MIRSKALQQLKMTWERYVTESGISRTKDLGQQIIILSNHHTMLLSDIVLCVSGFGKINAALLGLLQRQFCEAVRKASLDNWMAR